MWIPIALLNNKILKYNQGQTLIEITFVTDVNLETIFKTIEFVILTQTYHAQEK